MKAWQITILDIALGIGVFLIATMLLPTKYFIERTIDIQASPPIVFNMVNNLKNWNSWDPWIISQSSHKFDSKHSPVGKGSYYRWLSKKGCIGYGSMIIVESIPDSLIKADFLFEEKFKAAGVFRFQEINNMSRLSFTLEGELHGLRKWAVLLFDKEVGGQFQKGFQRMKESCERKK